jgi:cohesin complex subunit SA-1/2
MDDELQYRCAGYAQAEIERYADTLNLGNVADSDEDASDDEGSESGKKKKGKPAQEKTAEDEREYLGTRRNVYSQPFQWT